MSATPRLSVGLLVYNGEEYLAESLDALIGQSYEDYELIISDNASTDGTADICRRYARQDSRIRYIRQPRNIGLSPNRSFLIDQARGELFKEASHDDLYARDLLMRCVEALDENPHFVLAHSWTAAIDGQGNVIQALEYPLATDSASAPERFRSMLFGSDDDHGLIRADDEYGVIRTSILRQVAPLGSYYHADRVLTTEIALHGPFFQAPDWLYFRRHHPNRAQQAYRTTRTWCANLDPRRADRLRHPTARLLAEYPWGYVKAIQRAPLSPADRQQCYRYLAQWITNRAARRVVKKYQPIRDQPEAYIQQPLSVHLVVAGQEKRPS